MTERAADAQPTETAIAITTGASSPTPISGVYRKPLADMRALAIDDDEPTRRLLAMTLVNLGGAVARVESDAARFFERLGVEHVDLVIVDAMMPGLDGRQCLARVASLPLAHETTRYFLLSAASAEELRWTLPEVLRVRWLSKPFKPTELLRQLAGDDAR